VHGGVSAGRLLVICWFGSGDAECGGIVGSVVVIIVSTDISAVHQSISAVLLFTCWSIASRSNFVYGGVSVGR